jgi:DNA polymerase
MDTNTLDSLAHGIQRCLSCRLHENRTHAVPGSGGYSRRIVLLGEAPGEREDELGLPFMGRTGRFLDEFLEQHGFHRDDFFITPAVKCRPPKNRDPRMDELATCRDKWLNPQLDAASPAMILLAGKAAVRQTLGREDPLSGLHGRIFAYRSIPALVTYHPTAMMRFPKVREAAAGDLAALSDAIRSS